MMSTIAPVLTGLSQDTNHVFLVVTVYDFAPILISEDNHLKRPHFPEHIKEIQSGYGQ